MAVPVAGQIIRAVDAITYEDARPHCHAYDSAGNIVLNTGVVKVILLASELHDSTAGMHSTSSNTSRLVAPIDGLYRFSAQVIMPTATYTVGLLNVRQNANASSTGGTSLSNTYFVRAAGQSGNPSVNSEIVRQLAAGDYLEMFVSQTSGADRTTLVTSAWFTRAYLEYIASS